MGRQPALPFLCYSLLSKQTEYSILLSNIAVFGHRCEWVLTYKVSGSFRPNTSEVISVGLRHGSKIIQQNLVDTGRLMKTFAWKDVVLSFALQYSHMWLIDADIEFKSSNELDNYITSWFCGSVAGFPPLISQPTVRAAPGAARQDYLEVNHYSVYSRSGLSTIKSKVVENQVVLADMSFLNWYYQEVIGPYFEKIRSFNNTGTFTYHYLDM